MQLRGKGENNQQGSIISLESQEDTEAKEAQRKFKDQKRF